MIPKSLLVAYLSLRITEQPSPIARSNVGHVEPFIGLDSAVDVKNVQMPNVNHDVQQPFITQSQDVGVQAQTRYPFDSLPSGDWDNNYIYNGEVQITNNDTSRLWSIPDAFPSLKTLHGGIKAWGPYPQGNNFTIKFKKQLNDVTWTFGWLVNGRLSAGAYKVTTRKDNAWVSGGSGSWKDDQWTTWRSPYYSDQIDVQITEGIPTGLLLLEYLAYA